MLLSPSESKGGIGGAESRTCPLQKTSNGVMQPAGLRSIRGSRCVKWPSCVAADVRTRGGGCGGGGAKGGQGVGLWRRRSASTLDNFSKTLGSREQLAIAEFADALLVIPKTLAVNAGKVDAAPAPWPLSPARLMADAPPAAPLPARCHTCLCAAEGAQQGVLSGLTDTIVLRNRMFVHGREGARALGVARRCGHS